MKSHTRVAPLILISSLAVSAAMPLVAQQRWNMTIPGQTYTPAPAPRMTVPRAEPQRQQQYQPETRQVYTPPQAENRQYTERQSESRSDSGIQHRSVNVVQQSGVTAAVSHAMTYNSRPNGVHMNPIYFGTHYGRANTFHFDGNGWGRACPTCGFKLVNGESYFSRDGVYFGIVTPIPGAWSLAVDDLYIDIGDDGNYYLYDSQYPGVAVQLTFVQNPGDDQADADQDQDDGTN